MLTNPRPVAQFAHLDWSAGKRTRKGFRRRRGLVWRGLGWAAEDIVSEAMRVSGHCPHVKNPQPPVTIFGSDPRIVAVRALQWFATLPPESYQRKTKKGTVTIERKPRRDSPIMANGVISLPASLKDSIWPAYRNAVVAALQMRYGERLQSVVEHVDEAQPHIHFYLVPLPGESFGAVHPGYAARLAARRQGLTSGKVWQAYVEAMTSWADWLFEASGASGFGLTRRGPCRGRTSRQAALADKNAHLESTAPGEMVRSAYRLKLALKAEAEAMARLKAIDSALRVKKKLYEESLPLSEDVQNSAIRALEDQLQALGVIPTTRRSRKKNPLS